RSSSTPVYPVPPTIPTLILLLIIDSRYRGGIVTETTSVPAGATQSRTTESAVATRWKPAGLNHNRPFPSGKGLGDGPSPPRNKKPPEGGFLYSRSGDFRLRKLTLRELLATARLVEADLLTFDFTGIAGHEAGVRQRGLQFSVVLDQGTGDAVTDSASLAGLAATMNIHHDVEGGAVLGQFQRLTHDHAAGFAREELIQRLAVHDDLAGTGLQEHASDGGLATTGAVVVVRSCHYSVP